MWSTKLTPILKVKSLQGFWKNNSMKSVLKKWCYRMFGGRRQLIWPCRGLIGTSALNFKALLSSHSKQMFNPFLNHNSTHTTYYSRVNVSSLVCLSKLIVKCFLGTKLVQTNYVCVKSTFSLTWGPHEPRMLTIH